MANQKMLPSGDLKLTLTDRRGVKRGLPERVDFSPPFPGRRGRELANRAREQAYEILVSTALAKLAADSVIIVDDYIRQAIYDRVTTIVDLFYSTPCHEVAMPILKQVTEEMISDLIASLRAIGDNHMRRLSRVLG